MQLTGPRTELALGGELYPSALAGAPDPPKRLYVVGDPAALRAGLAVVGARKATPYGIGCARRFAGAAARRGVTVISGGARGCDAAAHRAALEVGAPTVAFLGGGCDEPYPAAHAGLFQRIVDGGGAVVSEQPWGQKPRPYMFRLRNRLIAGLARAVLIVEAGLPSGTFSTADEALAAGRDVLVVPGAITAASSRGANRLLHQGAVPVVDDETFEDALFSLFGCLRQEQWPPEGHAARTAGEAPTGAPRGFARPGATEAGLLDAAEKAALAPGSVSAGRREAPAPSKPRGSAACDPVAAALAAEPLGMEDLYALARDVCGTAEPRAWLMERLAEAERAGIAARYPDGRWGPVG
ncbi:DNA-processing protein DprA [Gordonibacter massiliensis (ex Traore et al. 2017)]|uniref:DNA-processing protein DprA n=1 Tax=Gordonibacter massiliensis (ex Traore et al. 2017) TaxID=1841863 RepID=UPI0021AF1A67|nr:DNA-processing protein DprA [Gordonibacter massiliensis (ex Traore et al. 2017)]